MREYKIKQVGILPGNKPILIGCIHTGREIDVIELGFEINKEGYPLIINLGSRADWRKSWLFETKEMINNMREQHGSPIGFISLHGCYSSIEKTIALCIEKDIKDPKEWAERGEHPLSTVQKIYSRMKKAREIDDNDDLTEEGKKLLEKAKKKKRRIEPYYFEIGTLRDKSADVSILKDITSTLNAIDGPKIPKDKYRINVHFSGGQEIKAIYGIYGEDVQILQIEIHEAIRQIGDSRPYFIVKTAIESIEKYIIQSKE